MSDIDCLLSLILKIMSLNKVLTLLCVQYAVMRKEIKSILTDILLPDYTFVVFLIISCEFSFCMIYYFCPQFKYPVLHIGDPTVGENRGFLGLKQLVFPL